MIKDILESLKDSSRERIKSPLLGSIVVSWMVLNWEIIFVLFKSNQEIEAIIQSFKTYPKLRLYVYPVILGAVISVATPWVNHIVGWLRNKGILLAKKRKLESEAEILEYKSSIISAEVRNELLRAKIVSDTEFESRSKELELEQKEQDLLEQKQKDYNLQIENSQKELAAIKDKISNESQRLAAIEASVENL